MGAKKAPPPPDTSKYSNAAFSVGNLLQTWGKEIYQSGQQEWDQIRNWGQGFMSQVMPAMEDMFSWANEAKQRYENLTMPQIESLFKEADTYASKAEEDRQRAAAVQDVSNAMEAQRAAHERRLRTYGALDPSEKADKALDRQGGISQAAASALAANQAGERTKEVARNLRGQAIGVGQGFAQQYAQGTQQAAGLGAGGIGTYAGAAQTGMGLQGMALPFMQGAYQGYDLGAGIVDTAYGRELQRTELNNAAQAQNFSQAMAIGQGGGNMIPMAAEGGPVLGPGGPFDDAGAIAISDGEYVVPADVVRKLGTNYFDKMIEKETGRPPPSVKEAIPIAQRQRAAAPQAQPSLPSQPNAGVLR